MRLYTPVPLLYILEKAGLTKNDVRIIGDSLRIVRGFDDYQVALPDDITWVDFEPLYNKVFKTDASVVILNSDSGNYPKDKTILITSDPRSLFDLLASAFQEAQFPPRSFVSRLFNPRDRQIGKNCRIDRSVKMGRHVHIGDNVIIEANVVIYDNVTIGDNVTIHSNCIIGGSPFTHIQHPDDTYESRRVWGNTIILDNVELASMTNIDRGVTGSTIIGTGTKTSAICHIGHDSWLGSNCYICTGVAIAGYVRIKNNCKFWGKSAVSSSLSIAENTVVEACAIVLKDVPQAGQCLAGFPAEPKNLFWRRKALLRKMASDYGK